MSDSIEAIKEDLAVCRVGLGVLLLSGTGIVGWFLLNPGEPLASFVPLGLYLIGFWLMKLINYIYTQINKVEELELKRQRGTPDAD